MYLVYFIYTRYILLINMNHKVNLTLNSKTVKKVMALSHVAGFTFVIYARKGLSV